MMKERVMLMSTQDHPESFTREQGKRRTPGNQSRFSGGALRHGASSGYWQFDVAHLVTMTTWVVASTTGNSPDWTRKVGGVVKFDRYIQLPVP